MAKEPKRSKEILPEDLEAYVSRLEKDSDRGAGLVAAALLDAQLENLFQCRLQCHQESLLSNNGPISTFASRIKVARGLGWIDADVEADLNVIREVRNKLAHSFNHDLSFSDPKITGWCSSLRTTNAYLAAFDLEKERLHRNFSLEIIAAWRAVSEPPRRRYLMTTHFMAQHLKCLTESDSQDESLIEAVTRLGRSFRVHIHAVGTVSNVSAKTTDA